MIYIFNNFVKTLTIHALMKNFLFTILLIIPQLLLGQAKVKEPISTEYDRNSISIVYISRGDTYDSLIKQYIKKYFLNSNFTTKFDINIIDTKEIEIPITRNDTIPFRTINENPVLQSIGKQILEYWFQRDENGMMSPEIIEARGQYNANDQDYLNSRISKIGTAALKDAGYNLIGKSYLLVLDFSNIGTSKNSNNETVWETQSNIYVYKLDYNEHINNIVMNETWIYEDDSMGDILIKKAAWDNMQVNLKYISRATGTGSCKATEGGLEKASVSSYLSAISNLENQIDSWKVVSSITHTRPVRSKIGTKEGVKNGARYRAYYFTEDENHKIQSKSKGYLRATKVANNRINTGGKMPESEFYQISGFKLEEGMVLRQSNDLALGAGLSYRAGSLQGYYLNLDKLLSIKTNSFSQYALVNIGFDYYTGSKMKKNGLDDYFANGLSLINVSLGYSFGIRPIRYIEFAPYILLGIDGINVSGEDSDDSETDSNTEETEETFNKKTAYTGSLGIRVNLNICYPVQIFGAMDYSAVLWEGEIYKLRNDLLKTKDLGRKSGIGFNIGLKYIF